MNYLAHIRWSETNQKIEQTVAQHNRACAGYAAQKSIAGLRNSAYLAGLLHDMGKYTEQFQIYLAKAAAGEEVQRGSVNHTFAGVRFAMERWHSKGQPSFRNVTCELVAVAAGAHHGLFDCIDKNGKDGFLHRMTATSENYPEAKSNFLRLCADEAELDELFSAAEQEVIAIVDRCRAFVTTDANMQFCLGLLARLLLSAVIDADRRDTAEFMHDFTFPPEADDRQAMWQGRLQAVEEQLTQFTCTTPIEKMRTEISDLCCDAAVRGSGVYRLSVPTGGGKTLSSLRYALATAAQHNKKHIFFVIPLLSILEQNATVIRNFVGDDDLILEHHSNLVRETQIPGEELNDNELLMESWSAPIVITTLVQFLNTLFLGKTSSIRRMNALANSVIVIDEVQSVPQKMLSLFNMSMNFLATACEATIVLCSATQPCLERLPRPLHYQNPPELIAAPAGLWDTFRRTEIETVDKHLPYGITSDELAAFALECMQQQNSLLIICNTKTQARTLYTDIVAGTDAAVYHLSTSMCMQHRIDTLQQINACLDAKRRVICVSTQLVEAGVDFSFACVIRVSAGLNSIVQAAGRCNRSGEFGRLCPVYIVKLLDERLTHLKEIRQAQVAAEGVLSRFKADPAYFGNDLASENSINDFYQRLYNNLPTNATDYPLKGGESSLYGLLSVNGNANGVSKSRGQYTVSQAFKEAGKAFSVFDDNTQDILVPYKEGAGLIAELASSKALYDFEYRKDLLHRAKRFSISVYDHQEKTLQNTNGLYPLLENSICVLQPHFYSEQFGLDYGAANNQFMEV